MGLPSTHTTSARPWKTEPIDLQTGQRATLSEIEFKKYAPNGKMYLSEFKQLCRDKSYDDVCEEEIDAAFLRLSTGDLGYLTYAEFLVWWKSGVFDDMQRQDALKFRSQEEKEAVIKARSSFMEGTGGSDGMTKEQFRLKCYIAGYCLTEEELDEAFQSIDKDDNGNVDFIEYLRWRMQDDRFAHLQFNDDNAVYIHQIAEFFRMYDTNLRGCLTLDQFSPLYESLVNAGRIQAPLSEVLKDLDNGGEGVLKLNHFVSWYAQGDTETTDQEFAKATE